MTRTTLKKASTKRAIKPTAPVGDVIADLLTKFGAAEPVQGDGKPNKRLLSAQQPEPARPTELRPEALNHHIRFTQYLRRYDRRREKVIDLRVTLEYERARLSDCERWRTESLNTVYREMHQASHDIAAATVIAAAQASLERVQTAMARSKEDEEEAKTQAKRVVRCEDMIRTAEDRLNRVVSSMMVSARKSIEHSGYPAPETDDLISRSTEADTVETPSRTKAVPPASVEDYFKKLGEKNIMKERIADIEFERREELTRREIALDQAEPGAETPIAYKLADEDYERQLRASNMDYERAFAEFQAAEQRCMDEEHDPEKWRTTGSDDGELQEDDDGNNAAAVPPRRTETLPQTMSTIEQSLDPRQGVDTVTIGPDPEDPQGLTATQVYVPSTRKRMGESDALPAGRSVERWMEKLPELDNRREYLEDSPGPADLDEVQPKHISLGGAMSNTNAEPPTSTFFGDVNAVLDSTPDRAQADGEAESGNACMDDEMFRLETQSEVESAAEEKTRRSDAIAAAVSDIVAESQTTADAEGHNATISDNDPTTSASRRSTGKSFTKSVPDSEMADLLKAAIVDMESSMPELKSNASDTEEGSGVTSTALASQGLVDDKRLSTSRIPFPFPAQPKTA